MLEIESCVIQKQKRGCGVACLATVLGNTYYDIAKYFEADLDEEGIDGQTLIDFLSGMGFDIITKAASCYSSGYDKITERILKPFADIHIIAGYQFIESTKLRDGKTSGHWLILTKEGKLLCPSDGKESTTGYLVFEYNIGIFYPPNWGVTKEGEITNVVDNSNNSTNSSSN